MAAEDVKLPDWLTSRLPEWAIDLLKASFPWLIAFIAGVAGGYLGGKAGNAIGVSLFAEKWATMPWWAKLALGAILGAIFAYILALLLVALAAAVGIGGLSAGPIAAIAAAIGAVVGAITIIKS